MKFLIYLFCIPVLLFADPLNSSLEIGSSASHYYESRSVFSKSINNSQINLEKYYINIYSKHNQQFSFVDLRYDYLIKNTKYKFSLFLNNVLNTSHYFTNVPTQTGFVMSDYKLRGRNLLIAVQMRL